MNKEYVNNGINNNKRLYPCKLFSNVDYAVMKRILSKQPDSPSINKWREYVDFKISKRNKRGGKKTEKYYEAVIK